jgi:hypothetical protein
VYDPSATTSGSRERIAALSVAAALLRTFGLRPLDHMESGDELQAVLGCGGPGPVARGYGEDCAARRTWVFALP